MSYLEYLPQFNYRFGTKDVQMSDIFRRVAFTQKTRESPENWKSYVMNGTETFDALANKEYNDPTQYWQIMMMNNIVTRSDGPINYISVEKAQQKFDLELSITSLRYLDIQPDPGDFVIYINPNASLTDWALVESYDPVNRTIFSRAHNGFFSTSNPGSLYHFRKNQGTQSFEFVQPIIPSLIKKYGNGPSYFYTNEGKISPYYVPSTNTFIDPDTANINSTNCLLELYIDGSLPTGYFMRSVSQEYMDGVIEKRNVKIPPKSTVLDVQRGVEELLLNGNMEDVIDIEGLVFVGTANTETV